MSSHEPTRRGLLIVRAIEPRDGKMTCEIQISYDRVQAVGRISLGRAKECGYIVPEVLQCPTAIFEGMRRDEDEDLWGYGWRCYCGVPGRKFQPDGTEARPRAGRVYLVFVNDERVAYNWRWENSDPDDVRLPIDHAARFRRRLL